MVHDATGVPSDAYMSKKGNSQFSELAIARKTSGIVKLKVSPVWTWEESKTHPTYTIEYQLGRAPSEEESIDRKTLVTSLE
jgi:hypothetical protein